MVALSLVVRREAMLNALQLAWNCWATSFDRCSKIGFMLEFSSIQIVASGLDYFRDPFNSDSDFSKWGVFMFGNSGSFCSQGEVRATS
jgi:hypothetical protein